MLRNVPVGVLMLGLAGRSLAICLSTWLMQLHPGERVVSQFISVRVVVTSVVRLAAHAALPVQLVRAKHATSSVGIVHCVWKFVLMPGRASES